MITTLLLCAALAGPEEPGAFYEPVPPRDTGVMHAGALVHVTEPEPDLLPYAALFLAAAGALLLYWPGGTYGYDE